MKRMQPIGKFARETAVKSTRLMLPQDANPAGNVHGGTIMKLVDETGSIVAFRHARRNIVTASIDRLDFWAPVYVGNLLTLKASLNYVGRTSMEVEVRVEAEDIVTGKVVHAASSYVTYVALDEKGEPTQVPRVIPRTRDEKRRYKEASARRERHLNELSIKRQH